MRTWQNTIANGNRTNCSGVATIDTGLATKNLATNHLGLQPEQGVVQEVTCGCGKAPRLNQLGHLGFHAGVDFFKP